MQIFSIWFEGNIISLVCRKGNTRASADIEGRVAGLDAGHQSEAAWTCGSLEHNSRRQQHHRPRQLQSYPTQGACGDYNTNYNMILITVKSF